MAEIQEVPLDNPQIIEEKAQDIQETPMDNAEIEETPAPKKKGRPPGAKNKPKPKPAPKPAVKPKAKKKPQAEYEFDDDYDDEDILQEAPPPRRRRAAPMPQEMDRHALAADVLNILQQQRYDRTHARRNHYASWFANM
mgnify:CR=1 FL=1